MLDKDDPLNKSLGGMHSDVPEKVQHALVNFGELCEPCEVTVSTAVLSSEHLKSRAGPPK